MPDVDAIERRLSAVERAVAGGDDDRTDVATATDQNHRLEEIEERLDDIEDAIADLEAATQAVRGYVGNVRSVNRDVERRADAALAAVDRLEDQIRPNGSERGSPPVADHATDEPLTDSTHRSDTRCERSDGASTRRTTNRSDVNAAEVGVEMPVPGARKHDPGPAPDAADGECATDGIGPRDVRGNDPDDGGLFDRVRDAL